MRFNQFTRTRYYIKNCDWELDYSKERERGLPCLILEIRRLSLTRSSSECGCEWHDQCDKSYPNRVEAFFIFRFPQHHFWLIHLMTYIFRVSMRLGLWQLQISSVMAMSFWVLPKCYNLQKHWNNFLYEIKPKHILYSLIYSHQHRFFTIFC